MYQQGEYTYEVPRMLSNEPPVIFTVIDSSEASARTKVNTMAFNLNATVQMDVARLKLISFKDAPLANTLSQTLNPPYPGTTPTGNPPLIKLDWNMQLDMMQQKLLGIETQIKEINQRSKEARL